MTDVMANQGQNEIELSAAADEQLTGKSPYGNGRAEADPGLPW